MDEFRNDQGSQDEKDGEDAPASASSSFSSFAYEDSEQLNQENMARAKRVGTMLKKRQSSKSKSLSKKEKIEQFNNSQKRSETNIDKMLRENEERLKNVYKVQDQEIKDRILLRNKEIAEDQFIIRAHRQSKKLEQDGTLEDSSSEFDQEGYNAAINKQEVVSVAQFSMDVRPNSNDWIIGYYSTDRLKFEMITCILVMYDGVMAPFQWAYHTEDVWSPRAELA